MQKPAGRGRRTTSSGAVSAFTACRTVAGAIQRGHGRTRPGLRKVNTFNLKTHLTAQWAGLGPACRRTVPSGSRRSATYVMVAVGDARGILHGAGVAGRAGPGPQAAPSTPPTAAACAQCCPTRACAARPSPDAGAGPGTGGHRAPVHRAPGRQHRCEDDGRWPHPRSTGAFLPVRAHLRGPRASRPVAPANRPGHHGAARMLPRPAAAFALAAAFMPRQYATVSVTTARLRQAALAWPLWTRWNYYPGRTAAWKYGLLSISI